MSIDSFFEVGKENVCMGLSSDGAFGIWWSHPFYIHARMDFGRCFKGKFALVRRFMWMTFSVAP